MMQVIIYGYAKLGLTFFSRLVNLKTAFLTMLKIQTFADLDAERKKFGFSARAVCSAAGYHYVSWSRWRNGASEIKLTDFNALIRTLHEMSSKKPRREG